MDLQLVDESSFTGFCVSKPTVHDCSRFFPRVGVGCRISAQATGETAEGSPKHRNRNRRAGSFEHAPLTFKLLPALRLQLAMESLTSLLEVPGKLPDFEPNVCFFFTKLYLLHACFGSVLPITCRSLSLSLSLSLSQTSPLRSRPCPSAGLSFLSL